MNTVQETFSKLREVKKEIKTQREIYTDALKNSDNHRKITEELKALREKKKQIETIIKKELGAQYEKIEDLALEAKTQQQMLDDIALTTLMKSETVEVKDEYNNKYGPEFKVKFKKDFQKPLF